MWLPFFHGAPQQRRASGLKLGQSLPEKDRQPGFCRRLHVKYLKYLAFSLPYPPKEKRWIWISPAGRLGFAKWQAAAVAGFIQTLTKEHLGAGRRIGKGGVSGPVKIGVAQAPSLG